MCRELPGGARQAKDVWKVVPELRFRKTVRNGGFSRYRDNECPIIGKFRWYRGYSIALSLRLGAIFYCPEYEKES